MTRGNTVTVGTVEPVRAEDVVGPGVPEAPVDFTTPEGCAALRSRLRRAVPPEVFEPVPARGVAALLQIPAYLALGAAVVVLPLPGWVDLLAGLVIGQMVTSVGLIAHDTFHRATFRSRWAISLLGWLAWPWWLFGPGLWVAWHVQAHHGRTQEGEGDPDAKATLAEYHTSRLARWVHAVTPGSGTLLSYVSLVFLFTMQGQLFLWHYADEPAYRKVTMDRRKERLVSLGIVAGWVAVCAALGPWDALCLVGIPMATSNVTLMMYIGTNHWLQPVTRGANNPFVNTTSVAVPRLFDWVHVDFSYHQEHHVFPQMSLKYGRTLRAALRQIAPDAVRVVPLGAAWRALYRTPALYLDDETLVRPDGTGAVRIADVQAQLPRA